MRVVLWPWSKDETLKPRNSLEEEEEPAKETEKIVSKDGGTSGVDCAIETKGGESLKEKVFKAWRTVWDSTDMGVGNLDLRFRFQFCHSLTS